MRRLLVAVIIGLILLVSAPAALAGDYPPRPAGSGVSHREAASVSRSAAIEQGHESGGLAQTGREAVWEFGVGAGLLLVGGAILVVARRRRTATGG